MPVVGRNLVVLIKHVLVSSSLDRCSPIHLPSFLSSLLSPPAEVTTIFSDAGTSQS